MPWMPLRPGRPAAEDGRAGGLDGDDADAVAELLAQQLADAGDGPAGADGGDEGVDLAAGGLNDLAGGRAAVDVGVGGVLELLGHKDVGLGLGELAGGEDGAGHALDGRGQVDLGAEAFEEAAALDGHVFGHGEDEAIALHRGDHGEPNAGIAGGRLDDGRAGPEGSRALRVLDHGEGDAVLDGAAGIHALELPVDSGGAFGHDAVETDEGRGSDEVEDGVGDLWPSRSGHI